MADRHIVVQCVDDQCNVFAQIAANIVITCKKFRILINKVCGKKLIKSSFCICCIEFFHSFCKESEGCADENLSCPTFLQKRCNLQNTSAGRNHIIDKDNIFAFKLWSEEFVSSDRMTAFDHLGIVKTSVIHTHVNTKNVSKVDCSAHASFIRADDHEVIVINVKSFYIAKKSFDKLIGRLNSLKTMKRSRILYTCIVSIKGDDVLNSHFGQFLECRCTVKRFTSHTFALTAFIKIWHDNVNSAGFTADCSNCTFQILKMIIRGHHIGIPADRVIDAVITDIYHKINIITTYGFADFTLTFTGTETWGLYVYNVGVALISFESAGSKFIVFAFFSPLYKPFIYFLAKGTTAIKGNKSQSSYRKCFQFFVI